MGESLPSSASPMITRPYGNTGRQTTVLGLGGAFIDAVSFDTGIATVRRALELGIGYVDTSPGYCEGRSQAVIGEALAGGHRQQTILATKLGYLPRIPDFRSSQALTAQLENNLRLLQTDAVDTLQIHEADLACWWTDDPAQPRRIDTDQQYDFAAAPVIQVLEQAKQRGRCRYIGITGNDAAAMTHVLKGVTVDSLLLAFNYDLLHRDGLIEALPLARARGMARIVGGVFQCGRLATLDPHYAKEPPEWLPPHLTGPYQRLCDIQRQCGLSPIELTLRYLLADETINVIVVGASSPQEIEASVGAVAKGALPEDLHRELDRLVTPFPAPGH